MIIKLNNIVSVECELKSTSSGFQHIAWMLVSGKKVNKVVCKYYNRTWEMFMFESVLNKMLGASFLTASEKVELKKFIDSK